MAIAGSHGRLRHLAMNEDCTEGGLDRQGKLNAPK